MKLKFTLLLTFASILGGCSKDDDNTTPAANNPSGGVSVNSPWQYSANIGGNTVSRTEGSQNFVGSFSWSSSLATPPDSSSTTFSSYLEDNNSSNYSMGVEIGTIKFLGNLVDTADFKAFIHTGNYSYASGGSMGVNILFVDGNGKFWSTEYGSADQTGSTFTISEVKYLGLVFGNYEIKVKATFNCKLYELVTGQSMTLTDGVYVGVFENYN